MYVRTRVCTRTRAPGYLRECINTVSSPSHTHIHSMTDATTANEPIAQNGAGGEPIQIGPFPGYTTEEEIRELRDALVYFALHLPGEEIKKAARKYHEHFPESSDEPRKKTRTEDKEEENEEKD